MKSVNVAELKNQLSRYLKQVRAGEEIVVRDRNLPIAKLVPYKHVDCTAEELALVAAGKLKLPERELDLDAFFAIGAEDPVSPAAYEAAKRAVTLDREEREEAVLSGLRLKKRRSPKPKLRRA